MSDRTDPDYLAKLVFGARLRRQKTGHAIGKALAFIIGAAVATTAALWLIAAAVTAIRIIGT